MLRLYAGMNNRMDETCADYDTDRRPHELTIDTTRDYQPRTKQ
jgi:hypothetical protein